jgi:hypothetical protein
MRKKIKKRGRHRSRRTRPEQRRANAAYKSYIHDAQKAIEEERERKWKERWK